MERTYRLKRALFINFNIDGIDREEAVTHVTLGVRVGAADDQERDACRSLHSRIDMSDLQPFGVEELAVMDVTGGLRDAYEAASSRARLYCAAKVGQEAQASAPSLAEGEGEPTGAKRPELSLVEGGPE